MAKGKGNVIQRLTEEARAFGRGEMMQQLANSEVMKRLSAASEKIRQNDVVKTLALAPKSIGRRLATAFAIALASAAVALLASVLPPFDNVVGLVDRSLSDAMYKDRKPESRLDGPVVMITVDQASLDAMEDSEANQPWPWARDWWPFLLQYLEKSGARAIAFDITFGQRSARDQYIGDDKAFAAAIDECKIPVVLAKQVGERQQKFNLPTSRPITYAAVNIKESVVRRYEPSVLGLPSLAHETVRAAGKPIPKWANQQFYLHFYGHHAGKDGKALTFRQVPAWNALRSALPDAKPEVGAEPDKFRDKIVLIGATAAATSDIKSSPLDDLYPGPEYQATAISNLLENRRVLVLPWYLGWAVAFVGSFFAAGGAVVPKRARYKMIATPIAIAAVFVLGYLLFVPGREIYWLPLGMPLLASAFATTGGLAWTYLVEDRQRRVLRKFLAEYVSPEVAEELDRRGTISLGGIERNMTVLFSDIAGFTTVSEKLKGDQLEKFMNFYLSELSNVVFAFNGTLDKYIGDAIMTFWNAPLDQINHAELACRTALGMKIREMQLSDELKAMAGGAVVYTRIGVNTGLMKVGNYGSAQKVNYTVFGDSVNLGSRLEGANKLYGSQILVAQSTVDLVKGKFIFRPLDKLKVKGKDQAIPVYELLGEGKGLDGQIHLASEFSLAFDAYQRQQWDESERILVALNDQFKDDEPVGVLLDRVRKFREHPPGSEWDGTYTAKDK